MSETTDFLTISELAAKIERSEHSLRHAFNRCFPRGEERERLHKRWMAANGRYVFELSPDEQRRVVDLADALRGTTGAKLPPRFPALCVYYCYNAGGELIYVGSSTNMKQRITHHVAKTVWWREVHRIRIAQAASRRAMLDLEWEEIKRLSPRHNVTGGPADRQFRTGHIPPGGIELPDGSVIERTPT